MSGRLLHVGSLCSLNLLGTVAMNTDHWITAVLALRNAKRVVVFTGAGVSAESGIPTFRDASGFWERFPPEQFAQWTGLLQMAITTPRRVAEFVLHVVEPIALAEANAAHRAIADVEQRVPTTVVTQNIDGLHQAAGSANVCEIHGSLLDIVDHATRHSVHRFERAELAALAKTLRRYVDRELSIFGLLAEVQMLSPLDWRGRHRPNLVLFGDALAEPAWSNACEAADNCDLLISVGTSGAVYPAALLPSRAEAAGATVISIDPNACAGCWLEGPAGTVLPKLVQAAWSDSGGSGR